jgi:TolA-binding protein
MMRCYDEDSNATSVRDIAQRILIELSSPDDLKAEALVKMGKWDYHEGESDEASKKFKEVIEKYNNQYTAEAKFREAQILLDQKEYTACQDACYEVLDYYSAYDYWLGKSMNLLGHAYLESGDEFNAKATWQSVIENFTEEQIINEAKNNLGKLN